MPINIKAINLMACDFKVVNIDAEKKFNLALTDYKEDRSTKDGQQLFTALASFDLMSEIADPVFSFICTYGILYTYENEEELKILPPPIVISHVISYLRELVSNMTVRIPGHAHLFFNPINTFELWARYQKTLPIQDSNPPNLI